MNKITVYDVVKAVADGTELPNHPLSKEIAVQFDRTTARKAINPKCWEYVAFRMTSGTTLDEWMEARRTNRTVVGVIDSRLMGRIGMMRRLGGAAMSRAEVTR